MWFMCIHAVSMANTVHWVCVVVCRVITMMINTVHRTSCNNHNNKIIINSSCYVHATDLSSCYVHANELSECYVHTEPS